MTNYPRLRTVLACGCLCLLGSNAAWSQQAQPGEEERRRIEQKLDELNALKADLDARIEALRSEVRGLAPAAAAAKSEASPLPELPAPTANIVIAPPTVVAQQTYPAPTDK